MEINPIGRLPLLALSAQGTGRDQPAEQLFDEQRQPFRRHLQELGNRSRHRAPEPRGSQPEHLILGEPAELEPPHPSPRRELSQRHRRCGQLIIADGRHQHQALRTGVLR